MREKKRREKKKKNYYFLLVAGLLVRCVVDPGRHTYTTKTHTIRFPLSFLLLLLLFLPSQGPSSLPPNRAEAVSSNWKSWKRVRNVVSIVVPGCTTIMLSLDTTEKATTSSHRSSLQHITRTSGSDVTSRRNDSTG